MARKAIATNRNRRGKSREELNSKKKVPNIETVNSYSAVDTDSLLQTNRRSKQIIDAAK